ncbi:MAG: Crp/Fnr family transcriptional regulator [Lachnospiraceae bacterium]|nr:Crp/Fnr family transcriptional regulator [Lachnospiraceae bacterium]
MNSDILHRSLLFRGLTPEEISAALDFLHAEEKRYTKGTGILHAGTLTDRMGLVLEGSVTIENNDMWGNRSILSHVGKGQFFAETYAYLSDEPMLVDVVANENCRILFLRIGSLRRSSPSVNSWGMTFVSNLLSVSAHKNLALSERSFHTAPKTIRGRVLSYLNTVSLQKDTHEFDIPFDRQQLADYLNLERSALSKELGKMQRDGLITVRKNHFIIRQV